MPKRIILHDVLFSLVVVCIKIKFSLPAVSFIPQKICVSSAKLITSVSISSEIKNTKVPKTVPCRTLLITDRYPLTPPCNITNWVQFERKP